MNQENTRDACIGVGGSTLDFSKLSQVMPCISPVHVFNPRVDNFSGSDGDPFHPSAGFFNGRAGPASLRFGFNGPVLDRQMRQLVSESFALQQKMSDAKALAASKSHSEAERRRRERINNHLAKLRSLLPTTIKTDKASLLAEVVQQVKELKRQTSLIQGTSSVPSETDEIKVDDASDEDGNKLVIKASICCDDRSDLLPDLIKTLQSLRLRTLKAEMTTLGGRVKNVLYITCEEEDHQDSNGGFDQQQPSLCISSVKEALQAVLMKCNGNEYGTSGGVKRQRTNLNSLEHRLL
ncbi:transcription factor bHLH30-like [Henckelia pumila]|uniref:transcription factor bHLH30-like n=1 Tax=Henckelia pumila TaxID=405737 RepID=UPI003C6E5250